MCGIFGYCGRKEAMPILLQGIRRLEYRGYDSVGIATRSGSRLFVKKKKGRVSEIGRMFTSPELPGTLGIAHTRWSTHGIPSDKNAHPHLSCNGKIAVVHNGIIENFTGLREFLEEKGHRFSSETDTEVIAHLIESFDKGDFLDAVRKALQAVEGAYGIAALHADHDELIAARHGSPLVIGIGKDEFFVSSDASAVVEHTKKVVYLDDGEIVRITPQGYHVHGLKRGVKEKEVSTLTWGVQEIEKKGYKHFMMKEIMEQPESLQNTLRGRLDREVRLSLAGISREFLAQAGRIIITACGTSWHAGLVGKYILEKHAGIPTEVDYASEFRYRDPLLGKNDLVVVISQSGETADTLAAVKEAKRKGATVLGIVNVVGSSIAREVHGGIYIHAGPEIGVASTKAFTGQLAALFLLAFFLAQLRHRQVPRSLMRGLQGIPRAIKGMLADPSFVQGIQQIAEKFHAYRNAYYLGRGVNFPVALEGALKLKEISYVHAEGYPAAEMKHGPIALIDENMPVIFIANKNGAYEKMLSNIEEVRSRKGKVIVIATAGDKLMSQKADHVIHVPDVEHDLTPLVNAIPLQLLAYFIADLRGCDIDQPRNLAKSVTVE
ncbi:MAG TPA: glutamine--fructose-6-phosphate transaminase (isomerizing) [Candidatus Nanoarchaeia archaeon]|nr:glutamine--fructose-6-phosphate transaminase (isomerizing) [Candidatus Nanoarchaeia archaeon]